MGNEECSRLSHPFFLFHPRPYRPLSFSPLFERSGINGYLSRVSKISRIIVRARSGLTIPAICFEYELTIAFVKRHRCSDPLNRAAFPSPIDGPFYFPEHEENRRIVGSGSTGLAESRRKRESDRFLTATEARVIKRVPRN